MGRYSSDSESGSERKRSSKKSKKKSKSRRRSRSSSYDAGRSRDPRRRSRSDSRGRSRSSERSRRSRSREDRRRKRRSPSDDSHRSKRSYRRSRSRSRTPRRRRSRTRSSSRDDGYSRRRRSRSHSRERSTSKKSKKAKKRSRSRERSSSKKEKQLSEKQRDPCENIPGFSKMPLAEQRKLRIRAAFDAVEETTTKAMEGSIFSAPAKPIPKVETAVEQIDRAQVLQDIEDDDFMPTNFSSSRSNKPKETPKSSSSWPKTLAEQEDFHEMAIFGNSKALTLDENVKKEISEAAESLVKGRVKWEDRDPELLAHPSLKISKEEAERRWVNNLNEMRRQKLIEMGIMKE